MRERGGPPRHKGSIPADARVQVRPISRRFCRGFDELRNFLRLRRNHHQPSAPITTDGTSSVPPPQHSASWQPHSRVFQLLALNGIMLGGASTDRTMPAEPLTLNVDFEHGSCLQQLDERDPTETLNASRRAWLSNYWTHCKSARCLCSGTRASRR
jgi:hypothetical protein